MQSYKNYCEAAWVELKATQERVNTQLVFGHRSSARNNKQTAVMNMTMKRIQCGKQKLYHLT